jgi:RNA polymerase sigma-70 factor, ECF subfamily
MEELTDEQLIAIHSDHTVPAARRRDAVNELFTRYQTRVALWCYRIAGDRDWARDLAQEVFVRALRSLPGFRGDSKFSTWLYTIARNHCFNALRSRSTRAEEPIEFTTLPDESGQAFHRELEMAGEIGLMQELLNRHLDETEQRVVTLHYGEDLTLSDITRLLGLKNQSGAKAHIVSARRKLARAIERLKLSGRRKEERR